MVSLEQDQCVKNWKSRIGPSWTGAFSHLKRFYDEVLMKHTAFKGMTFTEIVDWQSEATGREKPYLIKMLAQQWINEMPLRVGTKVAFLSHISSAFLHNHAELPVDRSFHFSSDKSPVEGKLPFNAFQRILHNCDSKHRSIYTLMAATFMGCGELVHVNTRYAEQIVKSVLKNSGFVKLSLPGRKQTRNKKNFYTLFSTKSDAGDALREYFKKSVSLPTDVLFRNAEGNPLTKKNIRRYFHNRAVEAGVIHEQTPKCPQCGGRTVRLRRQKIGVRKVSYFCRACNRNTKPSDLDFDFRGVRYGVNPHEIRDLMRTRWESSGANPKVAEFLMGHTKQVDPNDYLNWMKYEQNYPVQQYQKALPWLNVLSEEPDKISRDEIGSRLDERDAEIDALRSELAEMKRRQGEVMVLLDRLPLNKEMQKALRKK